MAVFPWPPRQLSPSPPPLLPSKCSQSHLGWYLHTMCSSRLLICCLSTNHPISRVLKVRQMALRSTVHQHVYQPVCLSACLKYLSVMESVDIMMYCCFSLAVSSWYSYLIMYVGDASGRLGDSVSLSLCLPTYVSMRPSCCICMLFYTCIFISISHRMSLNICMLIFASISTTPPLVTLCDVVGCLSRSARFSCLVHALPP
jgi:hypothetical protein